MPNGITSGFNKVRVDSEEPNRGVEVKCSFLSPLKLSRFWKLNGSGRKWVAGCNYIKVH